MATSKQTPISHSNPTPESFSSVELAREALRGLTSTRNKGKIKYTHAFIDSVGNSAEPFDASICVLTESKDPLGDIDDERFNTDVSFIRLDSGLCLGDGPELAVFPLLLDRLKRLAARALEAEQLLAVMLPGFWAMAFPEEDEPLEIGFTGEADKDARIDFAIALARALRSPILTRVLELGQPIEVIPEDTRDTVLEKCFPEPTEPAPVRPAIVAAWVQELRALADQLEGVGPDELLPEGVAIYEHSSSDGHDRTLRFSSPRMKCRFFYGPPLAGDDNNE